MQHVLRYNIIPKVGDQINITPLLFIITYFLMNNTSFNIGELFICYIKNITIMRSLRSKEKKYNLVLGHMFSYLLEIKYISYLLSLITQLSTSLIIPSMPSIVRRCSQHSLQGIQREMRHIIQGSLQLTTTTLKMLGQSLLCIWSERLIITYRSINSRDRGGYTIVR